MTKRLDSKSIRGTLIPYHLTPLGPGRQEGGFNGNHHQNSVLQEVLHRLAQSLEASTQDSVHRIVAPSFMSPALYNSSCSFPDDVLRFTHGLRALLRKHHERVSAVVTLPVSLYPRFVGLTRWLELLSDAVLELQVLPMASQHGNAQGLFNIHALPVHQERGGGPHRSGSPAHLSFKLSGPEGLVIEQFSLPPVDGEDKEEGGNRVRNQKDSLEF